MYIARILYPVKVLGPGSRIGIWFEGCPRRCEGCISPELWDFHENHKTSIAVIQDLISRIADDNPVDGFTISGGDPLYQAEAFRNVIDYIKTISEDILVYTGYEYEDIPRELIKDVGVLIDGSYEKDNEGDTPLTGSENQKIRILNPSLSSKYKRYMDCNRRELQNFVIQNKIITVGIPKNEQ